MFTNDFSWFNNFENLNPRHEKIYWNEDSENTWRDQYIQDGFIVLKNFFKSLNENDINRCITDILDKPKNGVIFENNSYNVRSQFDLHNSFTNLFKKLVPIQLIDIASNILGSNPIIYQSHLNFKFAKVGEDFGWHSDYVYWREQDKMLQPRAISAIIPLSEHNQLNGGLQLLRGSHKFYYPTSFLKSTSWTIEMVKHKSNEEQSSSGIVPPHISNQIPAELVHQSELSHGDMIIMDANTWHYSPNNNSKLNRPTLFVILISSETPFLDNINHDYTRPNYISCRNKISLKQILNIS